MIPLKKTFSPSRKTLKYHPATKTSRPVNRLKPARIIEYSGGQERSGAPLWSYNPFPANRFCATERYFVESADTPAPYLDVATPQRMIAITARVKRKIQNVLFDIVPDGKLINCRSQL